MKDLVPPKLNEPYKPRLIQQRLDDIKARNGLQSDYKLALYLGIGETALSNYRKGRSLPDADAAEKIAAACGEELALILIEIEAQRAKTVAGKAGWSAAAALTATALRRLPGTVAAVVIATGLGGPPPSANAATQAGDSGRLYIMLND